jgi:hypothetical protein
MNSGLKLGLQGLPFGKYGFSAHVGKLAEDLCAAKQNLRRLEMLREKGAAKAPSGLDLDQCIAACTAKVTEKQAEYDRAKAEL